MAGVDVVYVKQPVSNITVLSAYSDASIKYIYFNKFNKKACLSVGVKSAKVGGVCSKVVLGLSEDETATLIKVLNRVRIDDGNIHELISEGTRYDKQPARLVLRSNEYGGLTLLRVVATVVEEEPHVFMVDPDPVENVSAIMTEVIQWADEFEKFFISKKDNLKDFARKIREFYRNVQDY